MKLGQIVLFLQPWSPQATGFVPCDSFFLPFSSFLSRTKNHHPRTTDLCDITSLAKQHTRDLPHPLSPGRSLGPRCSKKEALPEKDGGKQMEEMLQLVVWSANISPPLSPPPRPCVSVYFRGESQEPQEATYVQ